MTQCLNKCCIHFSETTKFLGKDSFADLDLQIDTTKLQCEPKPKSLEQLIAEGFG